MTLLSIVQSACRRIAIEIPSVVVSSTDAHEQQLLGLATEEGRALADRYQWQRLVQQYQWTVNPALQYQVDGLPSDFAYLMDGSFFNITRRMPVYGPLTPTEWNALLVQNGPALDTVVNSYKQYYRIVGNTLSLYPHASADLMIYDYVRKGWNLPNGSPVAIDYFVADDDVPLLDEEAMILGLKWRYLKEKGLDYGESFAAYEEQVATLIARDGSKPALSTGRFNRQLYPPPPGIIVMQS